MQARLFAMTGALALVAAGCGGGPYYDASCDPTVDPYYYADCGYGYGYGPGVYGDPWGYCDAYGCYDVVASASSVRSPVTGVRPELSAVSGTLGSVLHAASEVRRVAGAGVGGADLVGPVDLDATTAPGVPPATYRILLSGGTGTGSGGSSWQLQAKPTGAPDGAYRTVFSGVSSAGSGHAAQGQFGVDLDAWSAAGGGGSGGGQVLASFADQGSEQATSYRLAGFRPGGSAGAFPDEVLTDTGPSKGATGSDGSATAALTAASAAPLAPAAPPTSMPGGSR